MNEEYLLLPENALALVRDIARREPVEFCLHVHLPSYGPQTLENGQLSLNEWYRNARTFLDLKQSAFIEILERAARDKDDQKKMIRLGTSRGHSGKRVLWLG